MISNQLPVVEQNRHFCEHSAADVLNNLNYVISIIHFSLSFLSLFLFFPRLPGETKTTVSPYIPGGVSDGQWHSVQLHYYNKVRNNLPMLRVIQSKCPFQHLKRCDGVKTWHDPSDFASEIL